MTYAMISKADSNAPEDPSNEQKESVAFRAAGRSLEDGANNERCTSNLHWPVQQIIVNVLSPAAAKLFLLLLIWAPSMYRSDEFIVSQHMMYAVHITCTMQRIGQQSIQHSFKVFTDALSISGLRFYGGLAWSCPDAVWTIQLVY